MFIVAWYFTKFIVLLVSLVVPIALSHDQIFYGTIALLIVLHMTAGYYLFKQELKSDSDNNINDNKKLSTDKPAQVEKSIDWGALSVFVAAPILCIASLYAMETAQMIYDTGELAEYTISNHQEKIIFVLILWFGYAIYGASIFGYGYIKSSDNRDKLRTSILFILITIYPITVLMYSVIFYPIIPQALGGGALSPVVVWINKTEPWEDINDSMPYLNISENKSLVRIDGLKILYATDDNLLLIEDSNTPNGILLPRSRVASISWSE